jgi:hypothetical protein
MARSRCGAVVSVLATAMTGATLLFPGSAGAHPRPVRVTFALIPRWLPSGYSTSGGGWISPPGGLRIYPNTGVVESIISTGSDNDASVPVLFTLNYYGYHNPESDSITVTASPANSAAPGPARPNRTLGHRKVSLYTYTQGALHNLNVDLSWVEGGDQIDVTTQGLPVAEAERFVEGLVKKSPPFGSAATRPLDIATTTTHP